MSEHKSRRASESAIRLALTAFREYLPDLHAYLIRRLHRGSDVPDLTMEIYERLLRNRRPEEIENPRAYVFRIASNVAREARGVEARSVVAFDSAALDEAGRTIEASDDVAERVETDQQLQQLRAIIAELPDMHQAVVMLALREGLSHKEVAMRTGLSVGSVGVYVCEARSRIRASFRKLHGG